MKITKAILLAAAIVLAGGLAACGTTAPAAAPKAAVTVTARPVPTVTVTPTPTVTKTVAPVPTRTVYVAPPAPVIPAYIPVANGTDCGGGVYAGADTSCPFALNVAANYTGAGADYAFSPVTGLDYTMYCNGGEGALDTVTCTGGDNALVDFTG